MQSLSRAVVAPAARAGQFFIRTQSAGTFRPTNDRCFSDLPRPPVPAEQETKQARNEVVDVATGDNNTGANQLSPKTSLSEFFGAMTGEALGKATKLGRQSLDQLERERPVVFTVGRAVVGGAQEFGRPKRGVETAEDKAALVHYQTLEQSQPGLVHKETLEKASSRAPQRVFTPEQFEALRQVNPNVAWIADNARFHKTRRCYGEALAEVRRMGGLSMQVSRADVLGASLHRMATDFKQVESGDLAAVLRGAGAAVLTGVGQLVAGDSYQRLLESGNYEQGHLMEAGLTHAVDARVNHSVILIDDQSGTIPNGYVLVYDMDPHCKRYAHLHDPLTLVTADGKAAPDPYLVPRDCVHNMLRIVRIDDLLAETHQLGIAPMLRVPKFPLAITPSLAPQQGSSSPPT